MRLNKTVNDTGNISGIIFIIAELTKGRCSSRELIVHKDIVRNTHKSNIVGGYKALKSNEIVNEELSEQENVYNQRLATKVSMVSIVGNLLLSVLKLVAGLVAHSQAMISDAVHSSSDILSSIVVVIGVKIASRESDERHPYGHERLECVAAIILATILAITGVGIGYFAIMKIVSGKYADIVIPGTMALVAAIVSIIVKEAMFWYTRANAKKIDSGALMADAWHHRSDALSSIGALIGIAGARKGYPVMEPIASIIICIFICKAAFDIYKDSIEKMIDTACEPEFENQIRELVLKQEGVLAVDLLQTRMFGNKIYVDLEIAADGEKTLTQAHEIAETVHDCLEETYPKIKHIMVHVNPVELR